MDDMALSWFTNDLIVAPEELRPAPTPTPPSVHDMAELIARVRAEEEANRRKVTFMCHPADRDMVDGLLRKAAAQVAHEDGPGAVRRWKLTASSHIPRGKVISWLDHLNANGKATTGEGFPPLGILGSPR